MEWIKRSEIDKVIEKFDKEVPLGKLTTDYIFRAGVEFAQSKFQEMFMNIITENQGLKLYKDNEVERFRKLAIEFLDSIRDYERESGNKICFDERGSEELYDIFLKDRRNGNISQEG